MTGIRNGNAFQAIPVPNGNDARNGRALDRCGRSALARNNCREGLPLVYKMSNRSRKLGQVRESAGLRRAGNARLCKVSLRPIWFLRAHTEERRQNDDSESDKRPFAEVAIHSACDAGSVRASARVAQAVAVMEMNWSTSCGKPDS